MTTARFSGFTSALLALCLVTVRTVYAQADPTTISIDDVLAYVESEDVVISASMREESPLEAPSIVTVLSASDFDLYQYESVADALRYAAGFDTLYDLSFYNSGVRGLNGGMGAQSSVLKAMISGLDVGYKPTTGAFIGPELIPHLAIRRVELIRGPASALYGANAFLGVINVIPYAARDKENGNAEVRATAMSFWGHAGGQLDGAAWWASSWLDVFGAFTFRQTDRSGLSLPKISPDYKTHASNMASLATENDLEESHSAYVKAEAMLREYGKLSLSASGQFTERTANFYASVSPLKNSRVSTINGMVRLRYENSFADLVHVNAFVARLHGKPTSREMLHDASAPNVDYKQLRLRSDAVDARLEARLQGDALPVTATLGADVVLDTEDLPRGMGVREGRPDLVYDTARTKTFRNMAAFGQVLWTFWRNMKLTGNVRLENHNLFGTQLSYRLGLVAPVYDDIWAKLIVGTAFKAPSPMLLYAEPLLTGGPEPNPDLHAQHALTTELFAGGNIIKSVFIGVTGYITRVSDLAEFGTRTNYPRAENVADVRATGLEVEAKLRSLVGGRLDATANAAAVWTKRTVTRGALTSNTSSSTSLYPPYAFAATVSFKIPEVYIRLFATDSFVGPRRADNSNIAELDFEEYSLRAHNVVAVGVASLGLQWLERRETSIVLKAANALNTRYAEPGFLGIDTPGERWRIYVSVRQPL